MKNNDVRTNTYFLYPCPQNNVHTSYVLEQNSFICVFVKKKTQDYTGEPKKRKCYMEKEEKCNYLMIFVVDWKKMRIFAFK